MADALDKIPKQGFEEEAEAQEANEVEEVKDSEGEEILGDSENEE
jgi:hypothetical protein